jgi:hypothetical protein
MQKSLKNVKGGVLCVKCKGGAVMFRATYHLFIVILAFTAACGRDSNLMPAEPTAILTPDVFGQSSSTVAAKARSSGCHTVKFNVAVSPVGPAAFEGPVTGDLVGVVHIEFDLATNKFAGATLSNSGTAHWTITGGSIPAITFDTAFENRNLLVDRPGSPDTLFENIGRHRATAGVAKANLTYHGTFTTVPTPVAHHDYLGVICP